MNYRTILTTDVATWEHDYQVLKTDIASETDGNAKPRKTIELQKLGAKIQKRLIADVGLVRRNLVLHNQEIARIVAASQKELKNTKTLAARYKRNTRNTEFVPQLKYSVKKLTDFESEFKADNKAHGTAWKDYRALLLSNVPANYKDEFLSLRLALMSDDKPTAIKLHQVTAARHEAEALVHILDKATMKADIKRNSPQRPIAEAQQAARDTANKMADLLQELRTPGSLAPKPNSITSNKNTLVAKSLNPASLQAPQALAALRGFWINCEAAYKLMGAKAANMEKVLTIRTRALRTNELTDPTVQAELNSARQALVAAKAEVASKTADYTAAKKAIAKIEATAKKLKIS